MMRDAIEKAAMKLTCPWCGRAFVPAKGQQRFCGPEHRAAFHRAARIYGVRAFDEGRAGVDEFKRLLEPYTAFQKAKAA